jgi:hypothetical protein
MVTASHVKELLGSPLDDPHLVLETGGVFVQSGTDVEKDPSSLVIASARELRDTHDLADPPADEVLETIAALLDDRVSKLGA